MHKWLLGLVLVFTTLFTNVMAEDKPRAVIIFDASGSMWGQINGKAKIEIARDALKNVIKDWNPDVELGLTVYGHRKKGDCNDIETVIPVGKVDKNNVIRTVMAIKPKGKTPISRSLRKVADEIKYTEEKATIILISDGKETCDPDPCGTAKELEKEGIDFVTHVIGFNVDKKTDKQLECIAHATGGEYFSAKNAAALNEAMKVIVKKVEVAKPKKLENNLQITASETKDGKWVEALHQVYRTIGGEPEDSYKKLCESSKKDPCLEHLPSGTYLIRTTYNKYKIDTPVELKDDQLTKVNVVTGQTGEAKIFASETEGGKWVEAYHYIHKVIDGEADESQVDSCSSGKKTPCLKQLPVGKYVARSNYNKFKTETPFEVKAHTTTDIPVVFSQTGRVEVSASETEGGKWVSAGQAIYEDDDGKPGSSVAYPNSDKKNPGKAQIPAGKYILKTTYNRFKKFTPFEVKPGETTKIHVVMGQTGKVEVSASETEGGKWVSAGQAIYEDDDGKPGSSVAYPNSDKKNPGKAQIPAGKYILKTTYNRFKKFTPFEVKPGETTKIHVVFSPFSISAKCPNADVKVSYEVYGSDGRMVFDKKALCSDTVNVVLDDGDYSIEAAIDSGKGEAKFSVGAGKPNRLILDLSNLNHEEEIKTDSQEAVVVPVIPKEKHMESKTSLEIDGKKINIEGMSEKDVEDIKKAAQMIEAFGSMFGGTQKKVSTSSTKDEKEADKELEEMGKDLEMFTK